MYKLKLYVCVSEQRDDVLYEKYIWFLFRPLEGDDGDVDFFDAKIERHFSYF